MYSHAIGSTLKDLVDNNQELGRNQDVRLQSLNENMKTFQQDVHRTRHKMPPLRKQDLVTDSWHLLGGRLIKAANTRSLIPWMKHLVNEYHDRNDAHGKVVIGLFDAFDEVESLLYGASFFFNDEQNKRFSDLFLKIGLAWMYLREESRLAEVNAWQIPPKVHICMHLPSQARLLNPRYTQVYGEEGLMGRVVRVWQASASGPYHATIQKTVLSRLWTGLECRMTA